jgi:hypothetical protein
LGPNVVLVGQGIANDIKWLNLREGVDYNYSVDLGQFLVMNMILDKMQLSVSGCSTSTTPILA